MAAEGSEQMQTQDDRCTPDKHDKGKIRLQRFGEILDQIKEKKNAIQQTCGKHIIKLKKKLETRRQKNLGDSEDEQPSKGGTIFVTRSSIDFEKIKTERNLFDYQPQAYPIIGACVIAVPYALKEAGFPLGLFILIFSAIMVEYSEILLIHCSALTDEICLQNISKSLFGQSGSIGSILLPLGYSLSVLLTYNVILCDLCTKLFDVSLHTIRSDSTTHRRLVLVLLFLIIIPISMTTNIKRIFKWSLISLLSASFVTVFVAVKSFTLTSHVPYTYNAFKFANSNFLQSTAVMTFAFSCQHTCRLYYATIDQNKEFNSNKPANIASSYSLLCTLVLGVCGYMTFKGVTQSNIMENYCEDDHYANAARLFFAAFILCLYPLECQSIRHLIQQIIIVHKRFEQFFNIAITAIILIPPFGFALLVDCLATVLEIAGLLFAVPLVYILPACFYLKLSTENTLLKEKLPCLVILGLGFIISLLGIIVKIFAPMRKCIHKSLLFPYCNGSSDLLGPLITLVSLNGTGSIDQKLFNLNLTEFEGVNITDIAAAYFT